MFYHHNGGNATSDGESGFMSQGEEIVYGGNSNPYYGGTNRLNNSY